MMLNFERNLFPIEIVEWFVKIFLVSFSLGNYRWSNILNKDIQKIVFYAFIKIYIYLHVTLQHNLRLFTRTS